MAKDVITRFKLETTQYDSKVKNAAKELSDVAKAAKSAGADFDRFTNDSLAAAKALGNISTSSTNAKDRAKELVGAFNDVARSYNQLTKEQQQSDFGNAMAQSLTQLQKRIKDVKQEMQGLESSSGGLFGGGKLDGMLQVFGGNLMTKGAGMIAGLVSEMGDAVKQGIELAKQGEGIRIAFERLGRGDILDGLREATHGTVTDIELMKAAVKFNDFKLPVEELGTMLAFAQQKAKDTGQSVDYMVDSIVTGLGRKSLMILDNLGLSAAEIKDKMKDTGDMTKAVGEIIREQMSKAGDYVETAADRAAQANVNMQNKMEELGRKFAPLEEASNQLWTSMKIGILDVIGGPLTDLLNKLTEAGRLRNALNNINGDGTKGNTQVGNQLKQLQAAKKSGASQYMLNTMQSGVIEGYNRQINEREQAIKDWNSWRRGNRSEGLQQRIGQWRDKYGTDVNSIKAEADAYRAMIAEYRKGAKDIMTPVTVDVKTDNAVKSLDELKVKLSELQAQRKKVAAGSDEAKRLDTEIRQVKADIKLQDPNALKTTHTTTPQEKASEMVATAERTYAETLQKSAIRMEAGLDSTLQGKKTELSAQERLFDAYNDAYATYKDPKYKEAANEAAEKMKTLAGEVKTATDAQKLAEQAARELAASQKKQKEATDKAIAAAATNNLGDFYKNNKAVIAAGSAPVSIPVGFTYTDSNLQAFIGNLKERIGQSEVGSDLYNALTKQLADANMLGNFISLAVKNGIDVAQIDPQALFSKIFGDGQTAGDFIPDDFWKGFVEQFKEKLGNGLNLNTNTGDVSERKDKRDGNRFLKKNDEGKYEAKMTDIMSGMAGGIGNVVSGLNTLGIEIPAGLQSVLGGMQAISSILAGIAVTVMSIEAIAGADAIIPFANGGIVPAFARGGLIGRAAGGLMIPGNSMSGDRLRLPVDGGRGMIGVNSGELILNKSSQNSLAASLLNAEALIGSIKDYSVSLGNAQQTILAQELEGGGMGNLNLTATIKGEQIRMALNNNGRRTGRGEYVQTNRR